MADAKGYRSIESDPSSDIHVPLSLIHILRPSSLHLLISSSLHLFIPHPSSFIPHPSSLHPSSLSSLSSLFLPPSHPSHPSFSLFPSFFLPLSLFLPPSSNPHSTPAIRLTRSTPFFNASLKAYSWKRFAIIKTKSGKREKVHVPWPSNGPVRRG